MILQLIGAIITLLGSILLLLGNVGILRMPDVYNRMQAGTKATTLGSILFFIGIAFNVPNWTGKLSLLIIFILITNPISSHALARASHFIKLKLAKETIIDELQKDEEKEETK